LTGAHAFILGDAYHESVNLHFYQTSMKSEGTVTCIMQNENVYCHCNWDNLLYF